MEKLYSYLAVAKQILDKEFKMSLNYTDNAWHKKPNFIWVSYTIVGKQYNGELRGDVQDLWLGSKDFNGCKTKEIAGRKLANLINERFHLWDN